MLSSDPSLAQPPLWAEGYWVQSSGSLSLSRVKMGGSIRVQADATLNVSGCVVPNPHSLILQGGQIRITDASQLIGSGMVVFGSSVESFTVQNASVHMRAEVLAGATVGAIVLMSSEFQYYGYWAAAQNQTGATNIEALRITLDEARSASVGLPAGTLLGTIASEDDTALNCARSGWQGWECLDDIDECLDENAGCHQVCANTPGSHQCECNSGYRLITGRWVHVHNKQAVAVCSAGEAYLTEVACVVYCSATQCEDIDECAMQFCAEAPPVQRDCRTWVDVNLTNLPPTAFPRCQHFCTNFEGTFQCSCDPGLIAAEDDAYSW